MTQATLLFLGLKGVDIQHTKTTRFAIVLSIIRKPIVWQIITRMVTGEDITCKSRKKSCMSKGSMSVYCHNGH